MVTTQDLHDEAAIEGAGTLWLWFVDGVQTCVQVRDTGAWYFVDTTEHRIDEEDARRLLDVYQIGYLP